LAGTRAASAGDREERIIQDIRFHVPTPVARAIELRTASHYPQAPADSVAPIEVTDLAWTNITAVQCSPSCARLIIGEIERARSSSTDATFRASCAAAIDAIDMAIIDSAPRQTYGNADRPGDMRTVTRSPNPGDDIRRER
jgi:hypothetical protein